METSPILLSLLLLWSFVFGCVLGALNDANRIVRVFLGVSYSKRKFSRLYEAKLPVINRPLKAGNGKPCGRLLAAVIFFQDILLFSAAGIGTVLLNYEFNQGRFRIYTILGIAVGFLLYYFTVGKIVMTVSEGLAFFIKAVFVVIFAAICRPFAIFGRFLGKKIKKIIRFLNIAIANIEKKLYNIIVKKKFLEKAEKGLLENKKK